MIKLTDILKDPVKHIPYHTLASANSKSMEATIWSNMENISKHIRAYQRKSQAP
jgi:hypothetical protein